MQQLKQNNIAWLMVKQRLIIFYSIMICT